MNQKYKVFVNGIPLIIQDEKEWKLFCAKHLLIEAAGGLVRNSKGETLFIFRNGKWDLPKGKIETGEDTREAAMREVEEECGIGGLKIIRPLSETYHTYELKGRQVLKRTSWFEMHSNDQKMKPQLEEGITEVKWIPEKETSGVLSNTYPSIIEVIQSANSSV